MSFRCHGKLIDRFASTLPVFMRFGLSTHDRVARCGVSWTLCACSRNRISWQATNTRACDIFGYRFHFWCVFADRFRPSFTLIWYVCAFVLIHFQERFQIRINVDERPKRIEMCAFSNDNVLVWGHSVFKKDRRLNVVTNSPVVSLRVHYLAILLFCKTLWSKLIVTNQMTKVWSIITLINSIFSHREKVILSFIAFRRRYRRNTRNKWTL